MAGTRNSRPYIKQEPDDYQFGSGRPVPQMDGLHAQNFGSWQAGNGSIDPSDLSLTGANSQAGYASQQNLSSSYIAGNSAIADDEIEELIRLSDTNNQQSLRPAYNTGVQDQQQYHDITSGSFIPIHNSYAGANQNSYLNQIYSSTPDGAPIQSPFVHSFNYSQWQTAPNHRPSFDFNNISPANMPGNSLLARRGFSSGERGSSSRSPMTPKTPATGAASLQHGIPDMKALSGHSINPSRTNSTHRRNPSSQWEGTPASGLSYLESPLSSPATLQNPQIAEVLESGSAPSMPTKIEPGTHARPGTTLEAKKQRRRESHNAVERRRRNNINDRIHELARLVPAHRLEDDLLKKQMLTGGIMSGANLSPPSGPQFLGTGGRRASGSLTQALPDSIDKGPAKGDVLNGAVSWTRDLMWMMHRKLEHERLLLEIIQSMGGQAPYHITDDEQRMRTELADAISRNDVANFEYTRSQASGLWVPNTSTMKRSSTPLGGGEDEQRLWGYDGAGDNSMKFKEEDEYDDMEL